MTSVEMRPPTAQSASADAPQPDANADAARLFEAYSEQLVRFCARRLDSRSEAEDAVQVTFLYALRALQRGVVPESESAWLHTIAANVCRWQRRTQSRRPPNPGEIDVDRIAAVAPSGDERGLCRDMEEALRSIPSTQRRALVLREWHGLSSGEVASRLGLSPYATYALLTRARRSFVQAFNARRETVFGLQLPALLHQLRAGLRALLGSASAKTAVATIAAVGIGTVAVDRTLGEDGSTARRAPPASLEPAPGGLPTSYAPEQVPRGQGARATRRQRARNVSSGLVPDGGDRAAVVVPPRRPGEPAPAPAPSPADPGAPEKPPSPPAEPSPAQPLDAPPLPEVDPESLLPPIELPPLPLPLPELPPLPVPEVPPLPLPERPPLVEDPPELPPVADLPLPTLP